MRESISILVLRLGLGGVFLWFGVDKCLDPSPWYGWVPIFVQERLPISIDLFLIAQGVVEAILGFLIVVGFLMRTACLFCLLILVAIIYFSGMNEIMVRDLGLTAVCVSLIISGPGSISLDRLFSVFWQRA